MRSLTFINDSLHLACSDHPILAIWWLQPSQIQISLDAKLKLSFIDIRPKSTSIHFQIWVRCNYMRTSWILYSMVKDLFVEFLYAHSTYELWKEISERYGKSRAPLIYDLERESHSLTYGNQLVFFTQCKWNSYLCSRRKIYECNCKMVENILQKMEMARLFRFLFNLNNY